MIIQLKIDVTKIDKNRLFKSDKTGAIYLDATLMLKEQDDQYGNRGMIVESVSKEERMQGVRGNILGNAKVFGEQTQSSAPIDVENDLPF